MYTQYIVAVRQTPQTSSASHHLSIAQPLLHKSLMHQPTAGVCPNHNPQCNAPTIDSGRDRHIGALIGVNPPVALHRGPCDRHPWVIMIRVIRTFALPILFFYALKKELRSMSAQSLRAVRG